MRARTVLLCSLGLFSLLAFTLGWKLRTAAREVRPGGAQDPDASLRNDIQRVENKDRLVTKHLSELRAKMLSAKREVPRTARELLARSIAAREKYRGLLNDPELQRLSNVRERANVRLQFSSFYRDLGLSPAAAASLEELLAEARQRRSDIEEVAAALGEDPSKPEIRELVDEEKRAVESRERELLGPDGFRRLQTYEATAPARAMVEDVAVALTFSSAPLTLDQTAKLLELLSGYRAPESWSEPSRVTSIDWSDVQQRAAAFLNSRQLAELGSSIAAAQHRELLLEYGRLLGGWFREQSAGR